MNKQDLIELIKEVMKEEQDYQALFKHMLDRTGKDINSMSEDRKSTRLNSSHRT